MKKSKLILIYIIIFVVLYSLIVLVVNNYHNNKVTEHLDRKTNNYVKNYNALYHEYKKVAEVLFITKIDRKKIKEIFKNATSSNENIKDSTRTELYNTLLNTYKLLKPYNIKQLHFHLPNNESFLRFHRPAKYGDNLTNDRETVKYVNDTKLSIDGFEEGKVFNGFRFVFPMLYNNKHIGSVEISFSSLVFAIDFMEKYKQVSHLLISKEVVDRKVFNNEKSNYILSSFDDFYVEKKLYDKIHKSNAIKKEVSLKSKEIVRKLKSDDKPYSIYDEKRNEILSFIKIQNPISKKVVAMFTIRSDAKYIENINFSFYIMLLLTFIVLASILYTIYNEYKKKREIEISLSQVKFSEMYFQAIEDASPNIIISSIGSSIDKANQSFLDFTGFDTLDEFKKEYNCICDLFIEKEGYLKKLEDSKNWFEYMKSMPNEPHKAIMLKDGKEHIFIVNANDLSIDNQSRGMATFVDITEQERIKDALHEKEEMMIAQSRHAAMGEMISMIAHQWRQPLSIISMGANNILADIELEMIEEESLKEGADEIIFQTQELSSTIEDFKNFFKPVKTIEEVFVEDIFKETFKVMGQSLENNNIEVITNFQSCKKIHTYTRELMQVFINIIKNAKEALLDNEIENKKIIIDMEDNIDFISIKISDNANGIPSDTIEKIFNPYFTTKNEQNGTGLGLYMSKTIIEKHLKGSLKVKNITNGVCFEIQLYYNVLQ